MSANDWAGHANRHTLFINNGNVYSTILTHFRVILVQTSYLIGTQAGNIPQTSDAEHAYNVARVDHPAQQVIHDVFNQLQVPSTLLIHQLCMQDKNMQWLKLCTMAKK